MFNSRSSKTKQALRRRLFDDALRSRGCTVPGHIETLERRCLLSIGYVPLYSFTGSDTQGTNPDASLTADASGNLYGTTEKGGTGEGAVYELPKTASGYGSPVTLYAFPAPNGSYSAVTFDSHGNLYGTEGGYGVSGHYGQVYELPADAHSPTGFDTAVIIYTFTSSFSRR